MGSFTPIIIFWYVFPVIVLFACNFLRSSLSLIRKFNLKTADLTVPFLFIGLNELSRKIYGHSVLPYFMIAVLVLGIGVTVFHAYYYGEIIYSRYFKMFWRLVFLLSMVLYATMIVLTVIHFLR